MLSRVPTHPKTETVFVWAMSAPEEFCLSRAIQMFTNVHIIIIIIIILESTWKYLNIFLPNSRPWKYLKTGQVLESPWIHQVKVCNISSSVKPVFCLKQGLLIIVTFCFYQLKLYHNHRNRYYMLLQCCPCCKLLSIIGPWKCNFRVLESPLKSPWILIPKYSGNPG